MIQTRFLTAFLLLAACGSSPGTTDEGSTSTSTGGSSSEGTGSSTAGVVTGESSGTTGVEACPDANSSLIDGQCVCDEGFAWCSPDDPDDLSCCVASTTGELPTTGGESTTGGGSTTGAIECADELPVVCDPNDAPFFCDHDERCGPEGSTYYQCEGGVYVPVPTAGEDSCKSDGFDFSYGCVTTADIVEFVCGVGPGDACEGDENSCADASTLNFCLYGKLGAVDCVKECQEVGDGGGVTYDTGFCGQQRGETACICCDEGDADCPL